MIKITPNSWNWGGGLLYFTAKWSKTIQLSSVIWYQRWCKENETRVAMCCQHNSKWRRVLWLGIHGLTPASTTSGLLNFGHPTPSSLTPLQTAFFSTATWKHSPTWEGMRKLQPTLRRHRSECVTGPSTRPVTKWARLMSMTSTWTSVRPKGFASGQSQWASTCSTLRQLMDCPSISPNARRALVCDPVDLSNTHLIHFPGSWLASLFCRVTSKTMASTSYLFLHLACRAKRNTYLLRYFNLTW